MNVATGFSQQTEVTGVVLSKLDGDARGGAAISVREVTGVPIKFAGVGESLDDFEPFHPERMAGRILGMGDVLSLIEKAESHIDEEDAERLKQTEITQPAVLTAVTVDHGRVMRSGVAKIVAPVRVWPPRAGLRSMRGRARGCRARG